MDLTVCVFDRDCVEVPVDTIRVPDDATLGVIIRRSAPLKCILKEQGFKLDPMDAYSAQIDAADGVIRFRDRNDHLGEGPNIAMMINLRLPREAR